jgi:hypothetical protein
VPEGSCDDTDSTTEDTAVVDTSTGSGETDTNDTDTGQSGRLKFPIRGVFYVAWFPEIWARQKPHYHPTLGYYSSDDTDVIDKHIEAMDYAKIRVAIVTWKGMDDRVQATRIPLLLNETTAMGSPLKWALRLNMEVLASATIAQIKSELDYLMSTYADHEAFARIRGKPVLFVRSFGDFTCNVVRRLSQASEGQWYLGLQVFEGSDNCPVQPDSWHQWSPKMPAVQKAGNSYVISPGSWRFHVDSPYLSRDINRWYQNVADMVASGEPWQLINSFNDWTWDGSAVESGTAWESFSGYGQYLDALHSIGGSYTFP